MKYQIKEQAPQPKPGVMVGDEVFFRHAKGDGSAHVAAVGTHGITVKAGNKHARVKWAHVLGHKKRAPCHYNVVENGEDGHLVEDAAGKRRFIAIPDESRKDPYVIKADKPGGPMASRPGLTKKEITDRTGRHQTKWVRTDKGQPSKERAHADAGAKSGYGTHNLEPGDKVTFQSGDRVSSGTIIGKPGKDGAHVRDESGQVHQVRWSEMRSHKSASKDPVPNQSVKGSQKPISSDKFVAADYAKGHDDESVTPESIIAQFPSDTTQKIRAVQQRLESIEQTIDTHKHEDSYLEQRQQIHRAIYNRYLSPQSIRAATPPEGQKPTFTVLGGRGGSGKSWFKGRVYDDDKSIVIDSDEIKGMLPEYEGWNAAQVHEESSDIADTLIATAQQLGLNVVLDGTMRSGSVLKRIDQFKDAGYRIEAHYMHLPRQEAAKRAVSRFLGKTQRYVPVDVVLGNKNNESVFDQARRKADAWSFRDNNVPAGHEPILISEGGDLPKSG